MATPEMHAWAEKAQELEAENARLRAAVDATLEWCDLNPEWYAWVVAENLRTALKEGE